MTLNLNVTVKEKTKEQYMEEAQVAVFGVIKGLYNQIDQGQSAVAQVMATSPQFTIEEFREFIGEETAAALDDVAAKSAALLSSVDIGEENE